MLKTKNDNYDEMTTGHLKEFYNHLKKSIRALRRDPDSKEWELDAHCAELERVRGVLQRR